VKPNLKLKNNSALFYHENLKSADFLSVFLKKMSLKSTYVHGLSSLRKAETCSGSPD